MVTNIRFKLSVLFFKPWPNPIVMVPVVKNLAANAGDADMGLIFGLGRYLEVGMETHSSIQAWRIPWTEKPGGLQSTGSHRVGHH